MHIVTRKINVDTNAAREEQNVAIINITPGINHHLAETYVTNGTVTIFLPGTTASIATIEYEEGLVSDFQRTWARIVPRVSRRSLLLGATDNPLSTRSKASVYR